MISLFSSGFTYQPLPKKAYPAIVLVIFSYNFKQLSIGNQPYFNKGKSSRMGAFPAGTG
jgi:hypothetical protein